jgi:hypothetical protein
MRLNPLWLKLLIRCLLAAAAGAAGASVGAAVFLGIAIIPLAFGIAFIHATFIGVPLYLFLRRRTAGSYLIAVLIGFFVGVLPLQVIGGLNDVDWHPDAALRGLLELLKERDAWLGESIYIAVMGFCGSCAAFIFFAVMQRLDPATIRLGKRNSDTALRQSKEL